MVRSSRYAFISTRVHVTTQKMILKSRQLPRRRKIFFFLVITLTVVSVFIVHKVDRNSINSQDQLRTKNFKQNNKRCALLFFGLIKDSFEYISLPSIQKNILDANDQCDVFIHTYNLTSVPLNKRNAEISPQILNVSMALLLTNKHEFESMASFYNKRTDVMKRTRKLYHRGWGGCCGSHDNMIKQWNSIHGVWNLMEKYESTQTKEDKYYEQVGLFRSDVYYTREIDIFDSKAAVPNFASHHGYNDRLFYGSYENAKIWAAKRFDFVDTFEKQYIKPYNHSDLDIWSKIRLLFGYKHKDGYHSETFVKKLLDHHGVRVDLKDHCTWRVRSNGKILAGDCDGMKGFSTFNDVKSYRPQHEAGTWTLAVE